MVVLEAVEVEAVGEIDPTDPCERDPDAERYEDQVRIEGLRLAYYAWPSEWLGLPTRDAQWRNRLAFQIFERELRLPEGQVMPWGQRAGAGRPDRLRRRLEPAVRGSRRGGAPRRPPAPAASPAAGRGHALPVAGADRAVQRGGGHRPGGGNRGADRPALPLPAAGGPAAARGARAAPARVPVLPAALRHPCRAGAGGTARCGAGGLGRLGAVRHVQQRPGDGLGAGAAAMVRAGPAGAGTGSCGIPDGHRPLRRGPRRLAAPARQPGGQAQRPDRGAGRSAGRRGGAASR
ncbi:MAG: hypothetical protein MZV63_40235 [Marinilabiliales bacterium]|nr:hypothetical protein [Marinilabiliales bacterium]